MFQFEHERGGEEHAGQSGQEVEPRDDRAGVLEAVQEIVDDAAAAGSVGRAVRDAGCRAAAAVDRGDVEAERNEQRSDEDEKGGREDGFEPLLTPAEPDHEAASSSTGAGGADAVPRAR